MRSEEAARETRSRARAEEERREKDAEARLPPALPPAPRPRPAALWGRKICESAVALPPLADLPFVRRSSFRLL
jgi:hypothetical protein